MGKTINLIFWRSVVAQSGWVEHEESQSSDSRQTFAREDSPSMLDVTIREGEEREMCSAVMTELPRIVKDQIGVECAVAMVLR